MEYDYERTFSFSFSLKSRPKKQAKKKPPLHDFSLMRQPHIILILYLIIFRFTSITLTSPTP